MDTNASTVKINSLEEVKKAGLVYFNGDSLAADVWAKKYCLKDDKDNYYETTPDDMHWRMAKEISRIEKKYPNSKTEEEIYESFKNFARIVPQGGPMSGIGNNLQTVSLSNCFVVGNKGESDSYGGILKIDQEQIQLMKRRGGVGHDLSHIRPSGSPVKNSALTSTGIVPFMARFSNSTKEVAQDGRRGALMLSISIKHPDSESFIDAKLEEDKITGANISVKIDDDFMISRKNENGRYIQQYPINSLTPSITKTIDSNKLWDKIIHNAWKSAEPGILFWDTIINESIPDCYSEFGFKTVSTNPCFPSSEYLLTDSGYVRFGDLFKSKQPNNVVTDNRIYYIQSDDNIEHPTNWKINLNADGSTIRKASEVFLTQENAKIIEIETSLGFKLKSTLDHHIATSVGMIEAQNLTSEHMILISKPTITINYNNIYKFGFDKPTEISEYLAVLIGLITGDGTFDKNRNRVHLDFWGDDKDRMIDNTKAIIDELYKHYGDRFNTRGRKLSKYFITNIEEKNKTRLSSNWLSVILNDVCGFNRLTKIQVPEFIVNNSSTSIGRMYVSALMYCDGSIQGSRRSGFSVRLSQSNKELLQKIQLILHSNGLLFSLKHRRKAKYTDLPNGKGGYSQYYTKDQYELISRSGSFIDYNKYIGFLGDPFKNNKFNNIVNIIEHNFKTENGIFDKIISKTYLENDDVFCIKEPISRSIIVNGLSTRRCGEIPLCPYDSCRLLALNLFGYVIDPFTEFAKFNWKLFKSDVELGMRIMDDIIDLEGEKIDAILAKIEKDPEDDFVKMYEKNLWERIKEMTTLGRRTGLGITAEGDMLAALGFRYGTDDANDFAEDVQKTLKLEAYRASVQMAKERGAFPIYNPKLEVNNPFIQRIKNEDFALYYDMIKYGRRNIALLTIAPTGSVSLMTQTTSGCEPTFSPVYMRRRKINPQEKNIRIDFVDSEGVAWTEYPVFHHKFELWLTINNYDIVKIKEMSKQELDEVVKKSPYYLATANDVDWIKKVEMQGRLQQHVDHSISVTVNLKSDATEELVSKVYETGWSCGCKGITVYRDGCRDGVLISNAEKNENKKIQAFKDTQAPKRPKKLKGEIVRFNNNNEKWIAVVGLFDERPYEMFTGKFENGLSNLPAYVKDCEIVKNKLPDGTKRYDIEYVDSFGLRQTLIGLSHKFNPEFWNYAKLLSGILRHGMPLIYVKELIESLNLNDDNLNTWKNGVTRVIKKYIKDGVKAKGKCPDCGGEHLEYVEGCLTCKDCGSSRCS